MLREQVSRGFYELVDSVSHVKHSIEDVLDFHKYLNIRGWRSDPIFNPLKDFIQGVGFWVVLDSVLN